MNTFQTIKSLFGITQNNGFSAEELSVLENNFGKIPLFLYEYYTQLGKVEPLNCTQDTLLNPQKVCWCKNQEYLIFYVENQWACVWGIHRQDLSADNPPVYMSYDEIHWQKETENLADFLSAMAHLQAVFYFEFNPEEFFFFTEPEKQFNELKLLFTQKPFCFSQWCEGIEFYGNTDDEVIAVFSGNHFTFAAKNQERFLEIEQLLDPIINNCQ